ncbi:MAG TPA: Ig-like domain-containing protein [Gemmatimonadaceae bacterium]|nr:Ig-like domain-containing protein [Gemmatimonadaceae bacterium]
MSARIRSVVGALSCVGVIGLAACGGGGGGGTGPSKQLMKGTPSGDAQSGTVGAALANPVRVMVMDGGALSVGTTVNWSILTGGGTITPSSVTGADGIATATWTLGTTSGAQTARATVAGASGSPQNFSATAQAGPADNLTLELGAGFINSVGSTTAGALGVFVKDEYGNPVAGTSVGWSVQSGTATLSAATANSNAAGSSKIGVTLPQAGASTIHATVASLTGSPVSFTVTGVVAEDVTITNNAFTPATKTITAGTAIRWILSGTGATSHTVSSTGSPSFTSTSANGLTGSGTTYVVVFATPGTYTYQCNFHVGMTGSITVQ